MRTAADLPNDIDELKRQLLAAEAGLAVKTLEAEKLRLELARLKRLAFGQSSERLEREIEQLELKLEEIETADAETAPSATTAPVDTLTARFAAATDCARSARM
jgi:chromosome segregation ATPase